MGVLFAGLAILGWGFGDFLIQKSARKLGDWEALFFITFFATVVLLPFIYGDLRSLGISDWAVLVGTSVVILVAGLLDFDALRVGKISIIEPIYAMEVPITIALSSFLIGESMTGMQLILIVGLLVGIFLVSNKHFGRMRMRTLEKGVLFAILATIGMGLSNFLFGFASRATDPLMINWFTSAFMAAATIAYLLYKKQGHLVISNWRKNKLLILGVSFSDNLAWVSYSAATLFLPIGLATGLTESYIALAAILGITLNKERLVVHQKFGLFLAVTTAIALALTAS
ncbi:MAG: DMT family transporter [Candidatus Paceibacterota bacterium]